MLKLNTENIPKPDALILAKAISVWENPKIFPTTAGMSIEQLYDLFVSVEEDKANRDKATDQYISYDDEIVEIIEIGEEECMDITVTGDNLFYANGILTKNSAGLPATVDMMLGIIVTEQLVSMGQMMFKQLKNRFADVTRNIKTIVGIDRPKMKLFQLDDVGADVVNNGRTSEQPKEHVDKTTGEITAPWEAKSKKQKNGDPFGDFKM